MTADAWKGEYYGTRGALAKAIRTAAMTLVSPFFSAAHNCSARRKKTRALCYGSVALGAAIHVYRKRDDFPITAPEWSTILPALTSRFGPIRNSGIRYKNAGLIFIKSHLVSS